MKIIQLYKLEPDDPDWPRQIDEAFNRVLEFAGEIRYSRESKVPHRQYKLFNRVVTNGEFTLEDWQDLYAYGLQVVDRANAGAMRHPPGIAESIAQAAKHLSEVLYEFNVWVIAGGKELAWRWRQPS